MLMYKKNKNKQELYRDKLIAKKIILDILYIGTKQKDSKTRTFKFPHFTFHLMKYEKMFLNTTIIDLTGLNFGICYLWRFF